MEEITFTSVKQIGPNYCVPACIESIAKDFGKQNITQERIVKNYPDVFPDDGGLYDEGKERNLETVFKELKIADSIWCSANCNFASLKDYSKKNEILLLTTQGVKHCVRFCGYNDESNTIKIMDPSIGDIIDHPIEWLDNTKPKMVWLSRKK